jgi:hypothetical protein
VMPKLTFSQFFSAVAGSNINIDLAAKKRA